MNRPLSRASTTSAASPAPESFQHDMKYAQSQFMPHGADVALMQYTDQNGAPIDPMLQHSFQMHPLQTSMDPYPRSYTPQDSPYMMQNPEFPMQIPSNVSISGLEQDDRRRKNSTATATNDKELRELLLRNELRALKDVAQEVIQKERTPQAEKTKQLFAMLWSVAYSGRHLLKDANFFLGCEKCARLPRRLFPGIASIRIMQTDVAPRG